MQRHGYYLPYSRYPSFRTSGSARGYELYRRESNAVPSILAEARRIRGLLPRQIHYEEISTDITMSIANQQDSQSDDVLNQAQHEEVSRATVSLGASLSAEHEGSSDERNEQGIPRMNFNFLEGRRTNLYRDTRINSARTYGESARDRFDTSNFIPVISSMLIALKEDVDSRYTSVNFPGTSPTLPSAAFGIHSVVRRTIVAVAVSPSFRIIPLSKSRVISLFRQNSSRNGKGQSISVRVSGILSDFDCIEDSHLEFRCSCDQNTGWVTFSDCCSHGTSLGQGNVVNLLRNLLVSVLRLEWCGSLESQPSLSTQAPNPENIQDFILCLFDTRPVGRGMMNRITQSKNKKFFLLFDIDSMMGVPLQCRANGAIQCFGCEARRGSKNLCDHALLCRCFAEKLENGNEEAYEQNLDEPTSIFDETHTVPNQSGQAGNSSSILRNEHESSNQPSTVPQPQRFKSFRNRRLFMCVSERNSLKSLLDALCSDEDCVTLADPTHDLKCPFELINSATFHSVQTSAPTHRVTILHTLIHGSFRVTVADHRCDCGKLVWFDGYSNSLYSGSRDHVFTRDILDSWLVSVCLIDTSFRDGYHMIRILQRSAGFEYITNTSRGQNETNGNLFSMSRRSCNDAFNEFLHCVNGTYERSEHTEDLSKLHICNECEHSDGSRRRFRALVVDGTATGILAALPQYQRHIIELGWIPNLPRRFFINDRGYNRVQKDAILRLVTGAKRGCSECVFFENCPNFRVSLKGRRFGTQRDILLSNIDGEEEEEGLISKVLRSVYSVRITDCDLEETASGRDLVISQRLDRKLRSCAADIIQLSFTDSIAGVFIEVPEDIPLFQAYAIAMRHVSNCQCEGIDPSPAISCLNELNRRGQEIRHRQPCLSELTAVLLDIVPNRDTTNVILMMHFCVLVADITQRAATECIAYFARSTRNISQTAKHLKESLERAAGEDIWQTPTLTAEELGRLTPLETGCLFPGRPQCRPLIRFLQNTDQQQFCNKEYNTKHAHSPGLLTVQCVCKHPKILGVIVMTQNESTALALSGVVSFFPTLPKVMYYDNACNLRRGIITRAPFLFHRMRLLIDRFHFKSHICSSHFDPTVYPTLVDERTTTAESINARLAQSRKHVRFLTGSNLIPFLRARMAMINLVASLRMSSNVSDIEDEDLFAFFDEAVPCSCGQQACAQEEQNGGGADTVDMYGSHTSEESEGYQSSATGTLSSSSESFSTQFDGNAE